MIDKTGSGRKGWHRHDNPAIAWSTLLALLCLLAVTSCQLFPRSEAPEPAKTIDLPTDVVPDRAVVDVERVDTDGDGDLEWLVFYRFDEVRQNGPVAALIYDVVPRGPSEFPVIFPYKLRLPNNNYLALRRPNVSLVHVVPESGEQRRPELVLTTPTEASFFRINPASTSRLLDDPSRYEAIGFFRSEDGVSFNPENLEVVVTSLNGYERSRLVVRRYYRPGPTGYFVPGTTVLAPPTASKVDFPAGIPAEILDTPYPEKIVLAFYQTLGQDNPLPDPPAYLTPEAAELFAAGSLNYGSPYSLDQLRAAVVKELGYYPTEEDSLSTVVTVNVVFISQAGERTDAIPVRWRMTRINQRWKMDSPE